jgi:pyruvate/2-oxoglutarate dehydrogenase complex dihydrolipoamide dehydrogenase (E3) component
MSDQYDVIVIGGGAAGLTAAAVTGELGKKTALVERERLGGDCTWTGCVPSKALLKVAKVAHSIRTADRYGISAAPPVVDMAVLRRHLQATIQEVYQHETPEAIAKRNIEIVPGDARFVDAHTIRVGERVMRAKKFVIATGGRAAVPPIPGLADVPYMTNHNLFDSDRLPGHLLIMGAGPIGMEMGQAHARLGARVTIIGDQVMARDEPEAVSVLRQVFEREGIKIIQALVTGARQQGEDIVLTLNDGREVRGDTLLVAVGRTPNIEGLELEKAGVAFTKQGIPVNPRLQTSVPHIYAAGDVTTGPKFTHYAGYQGSVAGRNALLPFGKANGQVTHLPWVTFTDPEVAHAGMTEAEARQQFGEAVKVFTLPLAEGDRSVAEDDTEGFVKLVYRGSGDLLGATVVAARAGEMIIEYQLVIQKKISLRKLAGVIHAYPTYSDVAKKALSNLMIGELLHSRVGWLIKQVVKVLP